MQALILAGGKGTRLRPYTTVIPKPLMPIGDYPILEIVIRQLKRAGFTEVILAVGYMSQLFEAFFQDGRRYGLQISYSLETEPLGTAGAIGLVLDRLGEDFLVMNGDLLTTLDYRNLYRHHKQQQAAASIGMYRRQVTIDFGIIESDENQRLSRYIEKPDYTFHVSMGIYMFHTAIIRDYVKAGEPLDVPTLMTRLHNDGQTVTCYQEDCLWLDIGRVDDYQAANEMFEARKSDFLVE